MHVNFIARNQQRCEYVTLQIHGRWICHCADRYTRIEFGCHVKWLPMNECSFRTMRRWLPCAVRAMCNVRMATSSSDSGALRSQHTRRVQCVQVQNWQWVRAKAKWLHVISIKWELTYGMHFQEENNNWIHMRSYIHIAFRNIFTIFFPLMALSTADRLQ